MTPLFTVLTLLLSSAQAAVPQGLEARAAATCNRDNCFREVFGTAIAGRSAQGVKDCTSYLQKTVTPCAVTQTSTVTATSTGGTLVSTKTATVTGPAVGATVTTTLTSTSTSTPTQFTTSTSVETDTLTTTVTATVTVTANQKRAVLEARTTAACPVTSSAASSAVPAYASDCTGTRFSSVCSCNGNVPTTAMTVPASSTTVKTTVTSLTTVISTTTLTSTVTPTNTVTSTVTLTVTATAPAITSTITATSTTQTTSTVTTTSTYTAPAATCTISLIGYEACNDGTQCPVNSGVCYPNSNDADCNSRCANDQNCIYYDVDGGGQCRIYYDCCNGN